jgi:hypothetical protein
VTAAVQAPAVRVGTRLSLHLAENCSTTGTVFWSIASEAELYILLPLRETLPNRKAINIEAAR